MISDLEARLNELDDPFSQVNDELVYEIQKIPNFASTIYTDSSYIQQIVDLLSNNSSNQLRWKEKVISQAGNVNFVSGGNGLYNKFDDSMMTIIDSHNVEIDKIEFRPYWFSRDEQGINVIDALNGKKYHNSHEYIMEHPLAAIIEDGESNGKKVSMQWFLSMTDMLDNYDLSILSEQNSYMDYQTAQNKIGGWGLQLVFLPHIITNIRITGYFTDYESIVDSNIQHTGIFFKKYQTNERRVRHQKHFSFTLQETYDAFYGQKTDIKPNKDKVLEFDYRGEDMQTISTTSLHGSPVDQGRVIWRSSNGGRFETKKRGLLRFF